MSKPKDGLKKYDWGKVGRTDADCPHRATLVDSLLATAEAFDAQFARDREIDPEQFWKKKKPVKKTEKKSPPKKK